MNLALSLKISFLSLLIAVPFPFLSAHADPFVAGEYLPPASAELVTDPDLLRQLLLGQDGDPVWCYSTDANALIVSAPQRAREQCRLKMNHNLEVQKLDFETQLKVLQVEYDSDKKKFEDILKIKETEIQRLEGIATNRPGAYNMWYATGGFVVGALTVIATVYALQ